MRISDWSSDVCSSDLKIRRLVIDAGVEAEFLGDDGAFRLAAGNADRPAATAPGQLANDAAHCAGSRRYHDRLARLRLAEMHQSDPGGDAGRTERAEIGRRRRGIDVALLQDGGSGDAVILPADRKSVE